MFEYGFLDSTIGKATDGSDSISFIRSSYCRIFSLAGWGSLPLFLSLSLYRNVLTPKGYSRSRGG